jgi:hypothetical protein
MRMHYKNSNLEINVKDNLTLNLLYTPTLRQNEAGTLSLGVKNSITSLVLPPGASSFTINSYCASNCMNVNFRDLFYILFSNYSSF